MDGLNDVLSNFFYDFCKVAKWVFAFRMAVDALKKTNESDFMGAIKAIGNGAMGFGSLYAIVNILDTVQNAVVSAFGK